jgi:hypothetical protein
MTKTLDSHQDASCEPIDGGASWADRTGTDNAAAKSATCCRCLVTLIDHLVRKALEAERTRIAKEEAEQWEHCFGPAAPPSRAAQAERIIQIASARAVLASMSAAVGTQVDVPTGF